MKTKKVVPKENHNYISWNRNWAVVKRHAPMVIKPFISGLILVIFWKYVICYFNLPFEREAENSMLFIEITFSSFTYAIFAGYTVNTVLTEYKEISKAVIKKDVDTFLLYRDEQLPILMHLLLWISSLYLIFFTIMFPYHSTKEGATAVFSVSSLLVLVYIIVTELDDYENSIWFKEKIPKEWYLINIADHFEKKEKEKKKEIEK